jgi:PiT family inorganic phosphate transporter
MVIAVVAVALVFDFTNGFHDTANAMATSIATGLCVRGWRWYWPVF